MNRRIAIRVILATGLVAALTAFALGGTLWLIGTFPFVFFLCATLLYWVLSATDHRRERRHRSSGQP